VSCPRRAGGCRSGGRGRRWCWVLGVRAACDSSCTCKLGPLFVSVKYVLVSVKLVCVYVKLLKI
jgi:hypothetical protein